MKQVDACAQAARDYSLIQSAVEFLTNHWLDQPGLDDLARHINLSPTHCQKLFKRWCGLSPKEFVQAITVDHARRLLEGSASILETAHEVGLSGGGRLHDLFVSHEAMTPGDYKRRGEGVEISYGFHASPFGTALVMATIRGVAGIAFVDAGSGGGDVGRNVGGSNAGFGAALTDSGDSEKAREAALADMTRRWPKARYSEMPGHTAHHARDIFDPGRWSPDRPTPLVLIGTDFEVRVWEALLQVPMGQAVSYGDLARHLGVPKAARAVGSAVGRNPISFVVPCHRVLRGDGSLGGYHWGLTRKRAMIGWETGHIAAKVT